eukprot:8577976-Pyramimonas_sp.AAC.1
MVGSFARLFSQKYPQKYHKVRPPWSARSCVVPGIFSRCRPVPCGAFGRPAQWQPTPPSEGAESSRAFYPRR